MKKARGAPAGRTVAPPAPASPDPAQLVREAQDIRDLLTRNARLERADAVLDGLRRQRLFSELVELGVTLGQRAPSVSPKALRLTAQGLIELGRFDEAEERLRSIREHHPKTEEALEAHGLLGRIYKQHYVNGCVRGRGNGDHLRRAALEYLSAYDDHPKKPVWHGINAVALLHRAQRDRVRGLPAGRLRDIAQAILAHLGPAYSADTPYWDVATIAEAFLALGDHDRAELWYHRAAWHEAADPFSLSSTIRQLREVWQLDAAAEPPGSRILPALDARLHAAGQTHLLSPTTLAKAPTVPLEKVFGTSPFMPFQAWKLALECAKSVCRVEDHLDQGIGTGFVVRGKRLGSALPDDLLLITNAHVMSPKGDGDSLRPADAHVSFYANVDARGRPHRATIGKILWYSPRDKLDATIARLSKPPTVETEIALAANLPSADSGQKVYVIGHPSGGGLMFSLNDNELLGHGGAGDPRVHYRTATEPGSSGSPVFNSAWQLIALHHAGSAQMPKIDGGGAYEANEGIAFSSIRAAIEAG